MLTDAHVLVLMGGWIAAHGRLPVSKDWRGEEDRPPVSLQRIYDTWGRSLADFHQACVDSGFADPSQVIMTELVRTKTARKSFFRSKVARVG